jgi:hypothetical protein
MRPIGGQYRHEAATQSADDQCPSNLPLLACLAVVSTNRAGARDLGPLRRSEEGELESVGQNVRVTSQTDRLSAAAFSE